METPPPFAVQPACKPDSNDRLLIILCHLSLFLGVGIILPLIIWLVKKQESENVAAHARESLKFHISLFIYAIIALLLCLVLVGLPLFFAVALAGVVLPIIAAIKASEDGFYRYPLTIRLVN